MYTKLTIIKRETSVYACKLRKHIARQLPVRNLVTYIICSTFLFITIKSSNQQYILF